MRNNDYNRRNPQKNISRLKLKKLKEDAKFNDQMRIERNSYLIKAETLKDEVKFCKDKIRELETELYFCNRNNKIEKEVNEN